MHSPTANINATGFNLAQLRSFDFEWVVFNYDKIRQLPGRYRTLRVFLKYAVRRTMGICFERISDCDPLTTTVHLAVLCLTRNQALKA